MTEITLADSLANTTTTSLLRSMCHHDDSILLGAWLEETDQRSVEEQLQPNSAAGSGALEHDPLSVFMNTCKVGSGILEHYVMAKYSALLKIECHHSLSKILKNSALRASACAPYIYIGRCSLFGVSCIGSSTVHVL